ncbi:hypothetical protein HY498_03445 [Candidatus Woesearchaeota archaeon]|nr:hypothetical protein [Candidatus Woesearchaeota archaeon]
MEYDQLIDEEILRFERGEEPCDEILKTLVDKVSILMANKDNNQENYKDMARRRVIDYFKNFYHFSEFKRNIRGLAYKIHENNPHLGDFGAWLVAENIGANLVYRLSINFNAP